MFQFNMYFSVFLFYLLSQSLLENKPWEDDQDPNVVQKDFASYCQNFATLHFSLISFHLFIKHFTTAHVDPNSTNMY